MLPDDCGVDGRSGGRVDGCEEGCDDGYDDAWLDEVDEAGAFDGRDDVSNARDPVLGRYDVRAVVSCTGGGVYDGGTLARETGGGMRDVRRSGAAIRSDTETRSDDPYDDAVSPLGCSIASRHIAESSRIEPTRANELLRRHPVITSITATPRFGG